MSKLSKKAAETLKRFSPDSEDGKCYSIPFHKDGDGQVQWGSLHISNPWTEEDTPLIRIKVVQFDDTGTADLYDFVISTGRSFCNCDIVTYDRYYLRNDITGDQSMDLGSTSHAEGRDAIEYVEASDMTSRLEIILGSLDSLRVREK